MKTKQLIVALATCVALVLSACGADVLGDNALTNEEIAATSAVSSYMTQQAQQATGQPAAKMCDLAYGGLSFNQEAGTTKTWTKADSSSFEVTLEAGSCNILKIQDPASGSPAGQQPAANATSTPIAPAGSCLEDLPKSVNRPFNWVNNLDVGDARLTSILFTENGSGDSLVALIDAVFNYDVEAPNMTGLYIQTNEWSREKLECATRELATKSGVTNLIYIGLGETPDGFTRDYQVNGFTTSIWVYTEMPIDTAPARWETFTVAKSDRSHTYGNNDAYMYGQFWNGINSKTVYHWITESGWQLTTPALQGTYWAVYDWSDVLDLVLARFIQMTGEVEQRDGHPLVIKVYCGYNDSPTGYSKPTQPSNDWICERMP